MLTQRSEMSSAQLLVKMIWLLPMYMSFGSIAGQGLLSARSSRSRVDRLIRPGHLIVVIVRVGAGLCFTVCSASIGRMAILGGSRETTVSLRPDAFATQLGINVLALFHVPKQWRNG